MHGIRVLAGAEVNVRRDGSLDIRDDVLARLDVVGVGVHTAFQLPREEMTRRLVRAMENPHVDIVFHRTARALGQRPASELDMEAILQAALRTGTVLEIDGQPERLDLKSEHVQRAIELGVRTRRASSATRTSSVSQSRAAGGRAGPTSSTRARARRCSRR